MVGILSNLVSSGGWRTPTVVAVAVAVIAYAAVEVWAAWGSRPEPQPDDIPLAPDGVAEATILKVYVRLDSVRALTRRRRGKVVTYGTVELPDGRRAFGDGALVTMTVENASRTKVYVSSAELVVLGHDAVFRAEYPELVLTGLHLEVPSSTLVVPLTLDTRAELHGSLPITTTQLLLEDKNSASAHHTVNFSVAAAGAGLWELLIRIRYFAPGSMDETLHAESPSFLVAKR
ncbi:hypothetical protein ABZ419_19065 [Streptomyces cinnamoneus]|uniref:hypothetical protein n=1 Tax=Streptomyces cinnamoneus TaxID=53446 RepID=UPI00340342E0